MNEFHGVPNVHACSAKTNQSPVPPHHPGGSIRKRSLSPDLGPLFNPTSAEGLESHALESAGSKLNKLESEGIALGQPEL